MPKKGRRTGEEQDKRSGSKARVVLKKEDKSWRETGDERWRTWKSSPLLAQNKRGGAQQLIVIWIIT